MAAALLGFFLLETTKMNKKNQIIVGDFVVSKTKPNCIQQVVKIRIKTDRNFAPGDNLTWLKLKTIWRLSAEPLNAKASNEVLDWSMRRVSKKEIQQAIERLQKIITTLKS